jgi:hypothetical protein
MYAFNFLSVSAIFLLALVQGVATQDVEPVPKGGLCRHHALFLEYLLNRLLLGETIAGPVCIETMWNFIFLTIRCSVFNRDLVRFLRTSSTSSR